MTESKQTPFTKSLSQPFDTSKPVTRKEVVMFAHHLYVSSDSLKQLGCNQKKVDHMKQKALDLLNRDTERRNTV